MLLGVARVVLGVRSGVRTALLVFAVVGTLLCVTWGGLLLWGPALPASLAVEAAALTAVVGGLVGLLRTLLRSSRDVAAFVDWRLEGGGAVMAAVEHDGPFLEEARRIVRPGAISRYAAPFFPRWASAAILPVALAILLASSSETTTEVPSLLTLIMPGTAGAGSAEEAAKSSDKKQPGRRLILVRKVPSGAARGAQSSRLFAELRMPETSPRPETGLAQKGSETGGGKGNGGASEGGPGTAEAAKNENGATAAGATGGGPAVLEIIDPEWAHVAERYLERLRRDR